MPSTARISAAQKAGPHPYTTKPLTNFDASKIIAALITSRNTPKVTIAKGKVMTLRINPSVAFKTPMTNAATSAD